VIRPRPAPYRPFSAYQLHHSPQNAIVLGVRLGRYQTAEQANRNARNWVTFNTGKEAALYHGDVHIATVTTAGLCVVTDVTQEGTVHL